MAAAALAIRAYATDHGGKRPPTLAALVPEYLSAVPVDPFAPDRQPLRYVPRADDPIVYGVGENMVDDGGSETSTRASAAGARDSRWSALDAVMHLTRQARDPVGIHEDLRDVDPTAPTTAPAKSE